MLCMQTISIKNKKHMFSDDDSIKLEVIYNKVLIKFLSMLKFTNIPIKHHDKTYEEI